jgi:hypothetical protein
MGPREKSITSSAQQVPNACRVIRAEINTFVSRTIRIFFG